MAKNQILAGQITDRRVPVLNNTARALEHLEIVFGGGFIGLIDDRHGIAPGAAGSVETRPDMGIHTEQIHQDDSYAIGAAVLHFVPQGNEGPGVFRTGEAIGRVPFSVVITATGAEFIEFVPPFQSGALAVMEE